MPSAYLSPLCSLHWAFTHSGSPLCISQSLLCTERSLTQEEEGTGPMPLAHSLRGTCTF